MDKISKFLLKLKKKERDNLLKVLKKISILDLDGLDIKKLKNLSNYFRVRVGKVRIIFEKSKKKAIIRKVDFRNNVYKK